MDGIGNIKNQIFGCSKKIELNGRKNMNGDYGDLTTLIPCEKIVMSNSKVPMRIATEEK